MRELYFVSIILETLMVAVCAYGSTKKKGRLGRCVCKYECITLFCSLVFIIFTFVPGEELTLLCKGLTLAAVDWMILLLMYYTQYYTELFLGVRPIKWFMTIFSAVDTAMLVANTWTHGIFDITHIGREHITVNFVQSSFWYKAHFLYTYIAIIMLIFIYAYMIIKAPRLYKMRYVTIGVPITLSFVFDIATIGSDSIYDFSMIVYGLVAIVIYYLTFVYVPNELIENMLSLIVQDMNNGIVCFDNHGNCVYRNDLINELYPNEDEYNFFEQMYQKWIKKTGDARYDNMTFDTCMECKGKNRYFEITYRRIMDEKGQHICDYFIYNDCTEVTENLEKEKYRASHDSLTGLLNREQFYTDVQNMLHDDIDTQYVMVCSNIKDFKFVNELFGIEKGNQVLVDQAKYMKMGATDKTLCARMMNDRFAMCLPKAEFDEKRMYHSIKLMQNNFTNTSFHLHIYIGVYDIHDISESVSIMCDKANIAGDTIKDNYEKSIAYYDDNLMEKTMYERRVIGEFDKALANDEFVMYLQPQVNEHGEATGAEALVRWQHPTRGLLGPGNFIEILENAGLIYRLDRYIWNQAAKKLADWKSRGITDHHISVNISAKDFYMIDIYETFTELVRTYDIEPKYLKLEITETTLMSDFEKNLNILSHLQSEGFMIEIDDFGSGYSSLNMLKDINADVLKIDMGFLRASENELKGQDILESIITLAAKIGMEVITEGVETKTQLLMLRQMGCHMFQGFYFSKPIPVDEFEAKYLGNGEST